MQRRNGYGFELQPPEAAIPPEEDAVRIDVVIALRDSFAKESPAVRAHFDALVSLLTDGDRKHWPRSRRFVRARGGRSTDRSSATPRLAGLGSRGASL